MSTRKQLSKISFEKRIFYRSRSDRIPGLTVEIIVRAPREFSNRTGVQVIQSALRFEELKVPKELERNYQLPEFDFALEGVPV